MKQRKSFSYSKVPMFSNLSFSVMGESKDFLKDQTQLHKFRISIRLNILVEKLILSRKYLTSLY